VGSYPDAIVAGDFTGDGRTDLAVANEFGDTVSVLLGNGDGTFQPARALPHCFAQLYPDNAEAFCFSPLLALAASRSLWTEV
jgi:FG-GAP-like repeat